MTESNQLRLLTIMNCWGNHASGMPTANRSLSRAMRPLGWKIDHLYLDDVARLARTPRLNYPLFGMFAAARVRALEAADRPYDVLQISGGDGFALSLLCRPPAGRRRLMVSRCHGLEHRYWAAYLGQVREGHERVSAGHRVNFGGLRLMQVQSTIRASDLVNCHTEQDAAYVVSRGWKSDDEVAVIGSGVEDEQGCADLPRLPTKHRLLWSGSWTWMKGRRVLVDVFSHLAESDPTVTLTVAGSGRDGSYVLSAFPAYLHPRIRVLPGLSQADLLREMREHRLLLATSLFEGFGTVVIEAMTSGLPVGASHVGGATDLIRDGMTGFLAPAGDIEALVMQTRIALCQAPDTLEALRNAARQAVAGFTWKLMAAQTDRIYRAALARVRMV